MSHPEHHNIEIPTTSTRRNSTTMDPIEEAIEYLESHEGEEQLSYRQVTKIFGVDRTTLSRRYNRVRKKRYLGLTGLHSYAV